MSNNLQCPVDFVLINENKARVNAFFVLGLAVTFLLTQVWAIFVLLAVDFLMRATNAGKYSVIGFLSDAVIRQLKIKNKPVDRAPKRFAAWTGFVFSVAILVAMGLHQEFVANVLAGVLVLFAFLESFAGFCAGCYVYAAGQLIFKKQGK
jgi:bifunctional ADP-heptose synthase (sugar kinase/adenylyltransferase)